MVATFVPALPMAVGTAYAAGGPGYTLEGCQQDGPHAGHLTLPNGAGDFICPDNAYTTGNLAKGWNELDLVPHRVTLARPSAGSFVLNFGGDHAETSASTSPIGWDVVSAPVLNTAKSGTGCPGVADGGISYPLNSNGGAYDSIQRLITFSSSVNASANCVYDYYQRLALGAHGYSGSSLQSYINSNYSGEKRVSLPVRLALPQELSKDMTATQDSDYNWNLTKETTRANLPLGDTCASSTGSSDTVQITVRWYRLAATPSGLIHIISNVYATNPAARTVTVSVTDVVYAGTTPVASGTFAPKDITSGATLLVGTLDTTVPADSTNLNDIATGTYTDKITGVPIPGTTTATASATVTSSGTTTHSTATVSDTESITGAGLTFSVATPSTGSFVSPDGGVTPAYTAGTATVGPVVWDSGTVSGDGSVVFNKTVYAAHATSTSSGSLSDTATLSSGGDLTRTASAAVTISSSTLATLTLTKTIPNILQNSDTVSFTLQVLSGTTVVTSKTFTFTAGQTTQTQYATGLPSGQYVVHEVPVTGWAPRPDVPIDMTGSQSTAPNACGGTVTFNNGFAPATANADKVTFPAGHEAGWSFTLTRPDATTTTLVTDVNGHIDFGSLGLEGAYTITETGQVGWDQTSAVGCSFTVNYPADNGNTFHCTITNVQRGHIIVYKHTNPAGDPQAFTFTPNYNGGTTFQLHDGESNDSGALVPCSTGATCYNVSEGAVSNWTLTSSTCSDGTTTYAPSAIDLKPGKTVTCHFYNTKYAHLSVRKTVSGGPVQAGQSFVFQLRSGASTTAVGTLKSQVTVDSTHNPVTFPVDLLPGTYQVCEIAVQPGWSTSLSTGGFVLFSSTGDNSNICHNETVAAGDNITVTVDNLPPPGGGARTIGYWKNWSSCRTSGGHQLPVLDRTLYSMEPTGLVLGAYLTLHDTSSNRDVASDCVQVVRLLNKSTIDNGTKMASDPVFGMVAQLVAALLNKAAGAAFPTCAATAVNDAENLLTEIHFNGITHTVLTSAQRTRALADGTALDNYNNFTSHC